MIKLYNPFKAHVAKRDTGFYVIRRFSFSRMRWSYHEFDDVFTSSYHYCNRFEYYSDAFNRLKKYKEDTNLVKRFKEWWNEEKYVG
jgi:hypothetical protein